MGSVKINSSKLRAALEESGVSITKLSTMVLDRSKSYIAGCLRDGIMREEDFLRLCKFIDAKPADMVLVEKPVVRIEEKKTEKKVGEDSVDYSAKIETLIVGLNVMYEEQSKTNELLTQLLQEIKVSNAKLERVEKRINSIDNSSGQTLAKMIVSNETETEMAEMIKSMKSTVNIINGRVTDMSKSVVGNKGNVTKFAV